MNTEKHTTEDWIVANNDVDIHYADGSFVGVATACNEGFAKQIVHEHKEYVSLLSENKKLRGMVRELTNALERIIAELDGSGLKNCSIDNKLHMAIYHSRHQAKQALTIK